MTKNQPKHSGLNEQRKDKIDKLVDIYLTDKESLTHSAGWHQESALSKMITYRGFIPAGTGNDQSNMTMIKEMEYVTEPHALAPMAKELVDNLMRMDRDAALALLANRFFLNCYTDPETGTVKLYKDTTRANRIGQNPKRYRNNLKRGYQLALLAHSLLEAGFRLAGVEIAQKKSA